MENCLSLGQHFLLPRLAGKDQNLPRGCLLTQKIQDLPEPLLIVSGKGIIQDQGKSHIRAQQIDHTQTHRKVDLISRARRQAVQRQVLSISPRCPNPLSIRYINGIIPPCRDIFYRLFYFFC